MDNLAHLLTGDVSPVRENNVDAFRVAAAIPMCTSALNDIAQEFLGFSKEPSELQLARVIDAMEFASRRLESYAEILRNGKASKRCACMRRLEVNQNVAK